MNKLISALQFALAWLFVASLLIKGIWEELTPGIKLKIYGLFIGLVGVYILVIGSVYVEDCSELC